MNPTVVGIAGIVVLLLLLALRMPVGVAMIFVGGAGFAILTEWNAMAALLGSEPFHVSSFYSLSVIPLFILMGSFATIGGMGRDLYTAAYTWIGHWRGGLSAATILACSGFSALSGSSVATAATLGRVALPEMQRYNYDMRLATGSVAAGGTLGVLIPPSSGFVIYAILTEQSIGRLFLAGVVPGILLTLLFILTIVLICRLRPESGPPGPVWPLDERMKALGKAMPLIGIVVITIGGIYLGYFTPTEAAAVGAFLTMLVAVQRRVLTLSNFSEALLATMRTTAMAAIIVIGAHIFSPFLAITAIPTDLVHLVGGLDVPPLAILLMILCFMVLLGMFLDGIAMLVLTLPVVFPIVMALGYDPIWFGVIMGVMIEMGLITPPVGLNVFVVKGVAANVPMRQIFIGVFPFWLAMVVCTGILIAVPELALFLPNTMMSR